MALVIIGGLALLVQYMRSPEDAGAPRISIKPGSYDFGSIPRELVEKRFIVENTGGGVLEVTSVSTSCGCTTAKVSRERINRGETAELLVRMDPNVMGNITGGVKRIIYVQSNDREQPEVEVGITANILG